MPKARTSERPLALALALLLLAAILVVLPSSKADAATALLDEPFDTATLADPAWLAFDDACLTKATATPPAGASRLGVCTKTTAAPQPSTANGYLQLTDRSGNAKGSAILNRALPSAGGLDVMFDQYQYGSTLDLVGRDGIGFFLADGSQSVTAPGAYGTALGYGRSGTTPGVTGGYLGIGLDVAGGYSSAAPGGADCAAPPGSNTNRLVARGPGQGTTGYCFLAAGSPPGGLFGSLREALTLGSTATPTLSWGRTIRVTVTAAALPVVTVYYGSSAGLPSTSLTKIFETTMTAPAPPSYKIGFAASTGAVVTDTHLIDRLKVSALTDPGSLSLVKQIDRTTAQPASYREADSIPYQFVVTNTSGSALTGVAVTDPKASVTCPTTSLAALQSITCTGSHTVTPAEAVAAIFVNTATATALSGSTAVSATASATAAITTPAPAITLSKSATLTDTNGDGLAQVGETIAYSFVATNGGNVSLQTSVSDPKAGTVSPASTTVAPGASATFTAAPYTVTQADVTAGAVVNTATVTGLTFANAAVSTTATRTTATGFTNGLTFTKTANRTSTSGVGTVITYTFEATNTGNSTLTSVAITDPKPGLSAITPTWPGTAGRLTAGQKVTATATYTTTAADVTAGTIANTATVTATPPTGPAITRTASATVGLVADPQADSATVAQGGSVVVDVLANDGAAATGATFSRAQLSPTPKSIGGAAAPAPATPVSGSVTCVDSGATRGQCTYRPAAGFVGTDVFDYSLSGTYGGWTVRVTITVTAVNHAPVARPDRVVATAGGASVTVSPLANDTDEDAGTTLTLSAAAPLSCTGTLCSYTPGAATGVFPITYTVSDGALSASSTVTVYVDPAPLTRPGFTDTDTTTGSVGLGSWTRSSVVATPVASCTAGRPSTLVSWAAAPGATNYTLERRLSGATAWTLVATPAATSFTDDRLGEGRSYQWRVRPDLYRWAGVASPASTAVAQPAVASARGC